LASSLTKSKERLKNGGRMRALRLGGELALGQSMSQRPGPRQPAGEDEQNKDGAPDVTAGPVVAWPVARQDGDRLVPRRDDGSGRGGAARHEDVDRR